MITRWAAGADTGRATGEGGGVRAGTDVGMALGVAVTPAGVGDGGLVKRSSAWC